MTTIPLYSLVRTTPRTYEPLGLVGKLEKIDGDMATIILLNRPVGDSEYKVRLDSLTRYMDPTCVSLSQASEALEEVKDEARKAWSILEDYVHEQAETRNWCDEFDLAVDELNESLPSDWQFRTREKEYLVEWVETYTVTVSRTTYVNATSEQNAIDDVCYGGTGEYGNANALEIHDAVISGCYEFVDGEDFTASEQ